MKLRLHLTPASPSHPRLGRWFIQFGSRRVTAVWRRRPSQHMEAHLVWMGALLDPADGVPEGANVLLRSR